MKKNLYAYLEIRQVSDETTNMISINPRNHSRATLALFVNGKSFGDDIEEKTSRQFVNKLLSKDEQSMNIYELEKELDTDYYWLPVYGYHHGGYAFSTTPFYDKWDSGRAGLIVIPKIEAQKIFSEEYKSLDIVEFKAFIESVLEEEVRDYDAYINGWTTEITITLDRYIYEEVYYGLRNNAILEAKNDFPAPINKMFDFVNLDYAGDIKIKAKVIAKVGEKKNGEKSIGGSRKSSKGS